MNHDSKIGLKSRVWDLGWIINIKKWALALEALGDNECISNYLKMDLGF